MPKTTINIQDGYLFQKLKAGEILTVRLVTGDRLEGLLKRFDRFALVLEHEGQETLVYKHGIVAIDAGEETAPE
ncbi:MAG: RNA chaperone Hfq [Thermoanaerobaculia bacterium]